MFICVRARSLVEVLSWLTLLPLSSPQRLHRGGGGGKGRGRTRGDIPALSFFPLPSLRTAGLHGQGSMREASAEERAPTAEQRNPVCRMRFLGKGSDKQSGSSLFL